ncbi:SDR family NAD(P)-dependent oxidoreductase [Leisingera aquaemixtae]|uniref:SDR family NAD(P)-dependent oxidoreductase n=1 Tax=Leisingera aquaemixtae TaxID=1396826 RepID=A0ABY5WHC6_9RHOB|nr:SDR family NAD(P)-dependent oxidoreductase [Leisingera aquaemixtae]UWQ40872.1 SDR family NAD(P)-dependent oxidoreductase [Leisingera aquaemixtae]
MRNIVVSGGSGAIGSAFVGELARKYPQARIHSLSRSPDARVPEGVHRLQVDCLDEDSLQAAAEQAGKAGAVDLMILAGGILHQGDMMPEKSLRELSAEKLLALFTANTIAPALTAKHFLPLLPRDRRGVFAALSARVGSISDNHLGGWYSYRASKAALNMIIRNAAIEIRRRNPQAIAAGLHPGTVESGLSQPFLRNVAPEKRFSPQYAVSRMLDVIAALTPDDSGQCFAWDGSLIDP